MWCVECSKDCGEISSHKCQCGHYKSKHAKEKPPPVVKDEVPDWKKGLEQRKSRTPSPSPTPTKKDDKKEVAKKEDPPKKASIKKDAKKEEPKREELKVKKEEPKKDPPKKMSIKKEEPKKDPPKLEVRVETEDKPKKRFFGSIFGEKEQEQVSKNVSPLEVDFGENVRSGWLLKLSHGIMSKFQKRYCMIRDGNLIYFSSKPKTENDVASKYIELEGYVPMVEEDPVLLKKLGLKSQCVLFKLIHPVKPQYTFATDTEELLIEWVKALTTELYREFAVVHEAPVNEGALQKRFQPMQSVANIQAEDTTWERDLALEKQMLEKRKAKKTALQTRNQALVKSNTERIDTLASKKEAPKKQVEQATGSDKKKYQAELDAVRNQLASAVESGVMLSEGYHQDLEELETPAVQKIPPPENRSSSSTFSFASTSQSTQSSKPTGLAAPDSASNSRNTSPRASVAERSKPPLPSSSSPAGSPRSSSSEPVSVKNARGSASEPAPSPKAASTPKAVIAPTTPTDAATPKPMSAIQQRKLELEKRDQEARAAQAQASPRHTVVRSPAEKSFSKPVEPAPTTAVEPAPKVVVEPPPESKPQEAAGQQAMDAQASALAKLEAARAAKAAAVERMQSLAAKERAKREAANTDAAKPAPEASANAKQSAEAEQQEKELERQNMIIAQRETEERRHAEEQAAEQKRLAEEQQRKAEEQRKVEEERKREERDQQQQKAAAVKQEKEEQEKREKEERERREKEERQRREKEDRERREKEDREKREKEEREKREKEEREKREKDEREKRAEAKRVEEKEAERRKQEDNERKQKQEQERLREEKVSNTPRSRPSNNSPSSIPANSKVGKLPIHQYDPLPPGTKLTGMPAMLHCPKKERPLRTQRVTKGFPGVKIKDFTKSWRDYWSLDPDDAAGNLEKAWAAAEKIGIAMLMDVEDILEYQDSKSIMTQITMFHRELNHLEPAPRPWENGRFWSRQVSPSSQEVKNLVSLVQSFERRYHELNLKQVEAGEGEALFESLKSTLPKIEHWKAEYPDELSATIQLYNTLNRDLPTKVNDFLVEIAAKRKPGGNTSTCAACLKPLSGKTVEAANAFFHVACFKCEACQKPLTKTCINVNDKPYCDQCGRNALGR